MRKLVGLVVCVLAVRPCAANENWTAFRGPSGQGWSTSSNAPLSWSESKNVTWKTPLPGRGWSSPVTWGDSIWLTTAVERMASEEEKAERIQDKTASQRQLALSLSLRAVCVDARSGKVVQDIELFAIEDPDPIHTLNSFASPTPVVEAGRLYCHFGTFGTACVDTASGEVLWRQRLPLKHAVGPGSSPILWKHLLVLVCDGMEAQFVAALDKRTGDVAWKQPRPPMEGADGDFHKAFSTPLIVHWNGQEQLVVPGAQWFVAYAPRTGDMLWHINHGRGFSNVAAPVFSDGIAYLITGFTKPELWAIPVAAKGKLDASAVLWEQTKQIPKKASPVLVERAIYLVNDSGVLSCVDVDSGEIRWTKRLGGNYSASPLFVAGKVYLSSHEGKTTVFRPSPKGYEPLAVNALDGQLMASPVPWGGALLFRSENHLYRIEEE